MKCKLIMQFDIEAGQTTCASEPGIFCKYLKLTFGMRDHCSLFGNLNEKDGWVQRAEACIKGGTFYEDKN